jgi:mannose-6-phosphate isomerase-like protein (cupin superfamily)
MLCQVPERERLRWIFGRGDSTKETTDHERKHPMKFLLIAMLLLTTAVLMTATQTSPSATGATYISSDQVAAAINKPLGRGGAVGALFIREPNVRVGVNRREGGEPEEHEKTTHNWTILEGEATMVTGGTMVDRRSTGTGQFRGSSIQGGQTYQLKKGDMITIPAGTPHWFKEVPTKTIAFYVVDLEKN